MDIWMRVARKRAKCRWCDKPIETGEYEVVGKLWLRRDGVARIWTIMLRWHPQCWIDQAKHKLRERPTIVETRGKKKLPLTDEQRVSRVKILMRRAAVVQRINAEMDNGKKDIDKIIHLGGMLEKLKEEIELVGGIPKSWV